jgi:hypothetical protein
MKKEIGFSKMLIVFFAVILLFIVFNIWLTRQLELAAGDAGHRRAPAPLVSPVPTGAVIPAIDPANDLLAPVARPASPHQYLKRRAQENTQEKEYGLSDSGPILAQ